MSLNPSVRLKMQPKVKVTSKKPSTVEADIKPKVSK